ncbi:uncharacterized protein LOC122087950 [Macadamia integrifolia]|uniref:uncharacterized protein LOC122087950 n=1 Tax=Macadamia integrifolia TaxID=60698 RepID=UPI001C4F9C29|nr:uncharacterized protein LOC122087950 [Macadamia integrifolia]
MEAISVCLHSSTNPFGFSLTNSPRLSLRHKNKHLQANLHLQRFSKSQTLKSPLNPVRYSFSSTVDHIVRNPSVKTLRSPFLASPLPTILTTVTRNGNHSAKCSYSNTSSSELKSPITEILGNLSLDSLKRSLLNLTPLDACKWSAILFFSIAIAKRTVNLVWNPFFWMYFSWTWLFWPWFVAIALAIYGLYCLQKHTKGDASIFEQLVIVTSTITWLTLVAPAHFNGFLEGWPFVFFFVYHYFFFFNVSVRKRLYGDYYARPHDPKWDVVLPIWYRLIFSAGVMAGHWLAAAEGPELHLIPGGWSNLGLWILIMMTLFMQYHSTLYLAKYSEKVVVPTAVVQFGPYRWVRHPIYGSTMLLFTTYFVALRAPLSLLFVLGVCLVYYNQKAEMEEALMVDTFGERYTEYMRKVRYKFIPLVY